LDELSLLKRERKGTETVNTILVTLACHSAIRGNFTLRREEMEELVGNLYPFNLSTTCPHGRPIFFFLDRGELGKQFKRKYQSPHDKPVLLGHLCGSRSRVDRD
jgi:DNA mismatch repair protein MutL